MAKRKQPTFYVATKPHKRHKKLPLYASPEWMIIHAQPFGKTFDVIGMCQWDGFRPNDQYGFLIADHPRFFDTIAYVARAWERQYSDIDWIFQSVWSDAGARVQTMPFDFASVLK
jgi:hypothetical protein